MVDTGVRGGVCDRLEGGSGTAGVGGRRHFPGEVNLRLVDARLLTALLHHGVLGVVRVAGGDAHQRVTWRGHLLTAFLCHLLDVIVVGERDHLRRKEEGGWVTIFFFPLQFNLLYFIAFISTQLRRAG